MAKPIMISVKPSSAISRPEARKSSPKYSGASRSATAAMPKAMALTMQITRSMLRSICRAIFSVSPFSRICVTFGSITVPMAEMKPLRQ